MNVESFDEFKTIQAYVNSEQLTPNNISIQNSIYNLQFENDEFRIPMHSFQKSEQSIIYDWIKELKKPKSLYGKAIDDYDLIFGKNRTQNIVSLEIKENQIEVFIEKNGKVESQFLENKFWILSNKKFKNDWIRLQGDLHYKFIKYYNDRKAWLSDKFLYKNEEIFSVYEPKEAAMLLNGFTHFKGMKVDDVSILFFDIETTGLTHDKNSQVLLISNTFVKNGKVVDRKLFSYDDYKQPENLFNDWSTWVREINPSILAGHNIFMYDLPYLQYCADQNNTTLDLGRDGSEIRFDSDKNKGKFRKDGSQTYEYKRAYVYGREIIDTMFLAYHFDFSRKYESYGLKQIIKQEGLEIKDRQFYDANTIKDNYKNPIEWEKIKEYCIHDSDDAKALYDLMIPAYFYSAQHIPKSFQAINYGASGSQLNSILIRDYLQNGHSLPKTSEIVKLEGGLSDGMPGIYSNVLKFDSASHYPSIILLYNIFDELKDPRQSFLKMVKYFRESRLLDKQKAKETGDRYYKEASESKKILINSSFGMLSAPGLLFNSPKNAALITEKGRELLKQAIKFLTGVDYIEKIKEEK